MFKPASSLPPEILHEIFGYLGDWGQFIAHRDPEDMFYNASDKLRKAAKSHLVACALVCRQWALVAIPEIWKDVTFDHLLRISADSVVSNFCSALASRLRFSSPLEPSLPLQRFLNARFIRHLTVRLFSLPSYTKSPSWELPSALINSLRSLESLRIDTDFSENSHHLNLFLKNLVGFTPKLRQFFIVGGSRMSNPMLIQIAMKCPRLETFLMIGHFPNISSRAIARFLTLLPHLKAFKFGDPERVLIRNLFEGHWLGGLMDIGPPGDHADDFADLAPDADLASGANSPAPQAIPENMIGITIEWDHDGEGIHVVSTPPLPPHTLGIGQQPQPDSLPNGPGQVPPKDPIFENLALRTPNLETLMYLELDFLDPAVVRSVLASHDHPFPRLKAIIANDASEPILELMRRFKSVDTLDLRCVTRNHIISLLECMAEMPPDLALPLTSGGPSMTTPSSAGGIAHVVPPHNLGSRLVALSLKFYIGDDGDDGLWLRQALRILSKLCVRLQHLKIDIWASEPKDDLLDDEMCVAFALSCPNLTQVSVSLSFLSGSASCFSDISVDAFLRFCPRLRHLEIRRGRFSSGLFLDDHQRRKYSKTLSLETLILDSVEGRVSELLVHAPASLRYLEIFDATQWTWKTLLPAPSRAPSAWLTRRLIQRRHGGSWGGSLAGQSPSSSPESPLPSASLEATTEPPPHTPASLRLWEAFTDMADTDPAPLKTPGRFLIGTALATISITAIVAAMFAVTTH
ncbi:uncharacterized protein BJ171DRAFT_471503 [Polychytrium aggregatum]|uniref:uncharacterized protein n=1 Tax=Polychytrium aggregatum TaxID=110093 RepID=UPI0022FE3011|nr:uncharacterized protein BJ171DRAFT_471503 [Polychytrium aggregatum]KAI9208460.1 hypothetical protein BJ171DRAFT_471503 [Polychytrium aggregatum]